MRNIIKKVSVLLILLVAFVFSGCMSNAQNSVVTANNKTTEASTSTIVSDKTVSTTVSDKSTTISEKTTNSETVNNSDSINNPDKDTVKVPNAKETFVDNKGFSSKTKYFIWVDTKNFEVNIFNGEKGNWTLIKSFSCSIGAPSTPTVKGNFKIGMRRSYFISGDVRCKYATQFYGNYMFHTVLFDKSGSTIVDPRMKMQISHGCVRLEVENAKYIYNNIPEETGVYVG